MKADSKNIWLFTRSIDLFVVFLPVWISWLICFLLPGSYLQQDISIWIWLVFVVGIDVSHVWSTIFRTYADKEEFFNHKRLLLLAPVISFLVFFILAGFSQPVFWRILAYIALYHFIKQQYGFMRIYKAKAGDFKKKTIKDEWIIYAGMIYPVVYWHLTDKRNFSWFIEGDFLNYYEYLGQLPMETFFLLTNILYWVFIVAWLIQEIRNKSVFYYGKILWVLSTAINWYLGIVYFNSDLVFTVTNVIAHGIPYLVLIFYYVERKKVVQTKVDAGKGRRIFLNITFMLVIVFVLAFGEEYFWDMLIYRENETFFEYLLPFPLDAFLSPWTQAFGMALLTVPQATHYIIDGFIWKSGEKNPHLKRVLMDE